MRTCGVRLILPCGGIRGMILAWVRNDGEVTSRATRTSEEATVMRSKMLRQTLIVVAAELALGVSLFLGVIMLLGKSAFHGPASLAGEATEWDTIRSIQESNLPDLEKGKLLATFVKPRNSARRLHAILGSPEETVYKPFIDVKRYLNYGIEVMTDGNIGNVDSVRIISPSEPAEKSIWITVKNPPSK